MRDEIWVLGATGRVGREVLPRLQSAGARVVVAGRSRERLAAVAPEARAVVGSVEEVCERITVEAPAVVLSTVGPYASRAEQVVRACPSGTHYVDVSNELSSFEALQRMDGELLGSGRTAVSGAGFGVLGTEGILVRLLEGRGVPSAVRVDSISSVATEPGRVGEPLAASIMSGLRDGGREVRGGRLVRTRAGAAVEPLTSPDGDEVRTAAMSSGELFAAWKASGASVVVGASGLAPTGPIARAGLLGLGAVLRAPGVADFATRRLAQIEVKKAKERPRESTWGHARVEWPSGLVREGWMRAGEAMDFTAATAAEVALRLARGEGHPGAWTPARLFGADLVLAVGGEFVLD
ncbi:saccharopine dehydrogenase NADP-binding domain-containing protein [Demetria terragena]|uniref:saccharopine dehydrogenase NADP-binding domain-containing protein n=1 Tax=Demetria terragena TaxID=63959 RepID=UPI00039BB111|nr:saccharopine dehydrogenase NADP-binding domain-containing protein [Demetria terragena]